MVKNLAKIKFGKLQTSCQIAKLKYLPNSTAKWCHGISIHSKWIIKHVYIRTCIPATPYMPFEVSACLTSASQCLPIRAQKIRSTYMLMNKCSKCSNIRKYLAQIC